MLRWCHPSLYLQGLAQSGGSAQSQVWGLPKVTQLVADPGLGLLLGLALQLIPTTRVLGTFLNPATLTVCLWLYRTECKLESVPSCPFPTW